MLPAVPYLCHVTVIEYADVKTPLLLVYNVIAASMDTSGIPMPGVSNAHVTVANTGQMELVAVVSY